MDDQHLKNLDTPWHIGYTKKHEDDPRRHRSRCRNYIFERKGCRAGFSHCIGSAHCSSYNEYSPEEYQEEQERRKKLGDKERKNHSRRGNAPNTKCSGGQSRKSPVVGGRYHSNRYGYGDITNVRGDVITVRFGNGPLLKIDYKTGQIIDSNQAATKKPESQNTNTSIKTIVRNFGKTKNINSASNKPDNHHKPNAIEIVNHIYYGKGKVLNRFKNEKGQIVVVVQFYEKYALKREVIWELEKGNFI